MESGGAVIHGRGHPEVGLVSQPIKVIDVAGQFGIFGLCCGRCERSIRAPFAMCWSGATGGRTFLSLMLVGVCGGLMRPLSGLAPRGRGDPG